MGFFWEGWRADVTKKAAYQNDGTGGNGSRCPVPGQGGEGEGFRVNSRPGRA